MPIEARPFPGSKQPRQKARKTEGDSLWEPTCNFFPQTKSDSKQIPEAHPGLIRQKHNPQILTSII